MQVYLQRGHWAPQGHFSCRIWPPEQGCSRGRRIGENAREGAEVPGRWLKPPPVPTGTVNSTAWVRKGSWGPKVKQFRNWIKAEVTTQIPESVMHDSPPAHQQQWPKHSKEILFGKWFQHCYQSTARQSMSFFIFYHPLASFGPSGDHSDVKEQVGGSVEAGEC